MNNKYREKYLHIAREIVLRHINSDKYAVFLFGSWAEKKARKDSDLDIGIWGEDPLSSITRSKITLAFEESIVPWPIDLVDFSRTTEDFNRIALQDIHYWNNPFDKDIKMQLLNTETMYETK